MHFMMDECEGAIHNVWMKGYFHYGYDLQWMNAMIEIGIDRYNDSFMIDASYDG